MSDDNKFTKNNVFKTEQHNILEKILTILDLQPNDGKTLSKTILETKYDEIELLLPNIKKYYDATVWKNISSASNKATSIIRCILKHHKLKLSYKVIAVKKNENEPTTSLSYFIKNI